MSFIEDPDFEATLRQSRRLNEIITDKAENVSKLAGALVNEDTGNYRRKLKVRRSRNGTAAVEAHDIAGHLIEFGGPNNAAQAPLRRAADVICDGFTREPKP